MAIETRSVTEKGNQPYEIAVVRCRLENIAPEGWMEDKRYRASWARQPPLPASFKDAYLEDRASDAAKATKWHRLVLEALEKANGNAIIENVVFHVGYTHTTMLKSNIDDLKFISTSFERPV